MRCALLWLVLLLPSFSFSATFSLQLENIRVAELARIVFGDVLQRNYVLDDEIQTSMDSVTLSWSALSKKELEAMTRELFALRGFEAEQKGSIMLLRKRKDDDLQILVYRPRNRGARYLSDIVQKVAGVQSLGTRSMQAPAAMQQAAQQQPMQQGSVPSVISQGATDQLAYECAAKLCERLRGLLEQIDTPEAQVVLRAAVYEVGTTKGEGGAVQLAARLFQGSLSVSTGAVVGATTATIKAANLDAVLSLLDQDGRFKSISRPLLRVLSGSTATLSVGQQVPVLGAVTQDKNGNPIQSVDYRPSGTILTVQPEVRAESVDLNVTQELSSFVTTTTGVNATPTLLQRKASSHLSIKPGEVVVFAGLEEAREDQSSTGLFGLSLSNRENRTTSEVLVFIEAQRI